MTEAGILEDTVPTAESRLGSQQPTKVDELREQAKALDISDDLLNDGLVLVSLMPDESGKMTEEQRDLLREWLFGKLDKVPGAEHVINSFRSGKLDTTSAIRELFGLARSIDPTGSLAATQQLVDISEGKAQFDTTKAMSLIVNSLPPKTRMIARAFLSTRKKKIKASLENIALVEKGHAPSGPTSTEQTYAEEVQHA